MFFSKDGSWKNIVQVGGTASTMGLHIVSGTIAGLAIGYFLDDYFGTKPWLIMIFLVLGIMAGFKMVWEDFQRLQRRQKEQQHGSLKQEGEKSAGEDQSED